MTHPAPVSKDSASDGCRGGTDDGRISRANTLRLRTLAAVLPQDAGWWVSRDLACRTSAAVMGHPTATTCHLIRPIDYGQWAGLTIAEVARVDPSGASAWAADAARMPQGGEPLAAVRGRAGTAISQVRRSSRPVVAVATGGILRILLMVALDLTDNAFWHLDIACCSMSELEWRGDRWRLVRLNN